MYSHSVYFINSIYNSRNLSTPLSAAERSQLEKSLEIDSKGSLFSAADSLAQGIAHLDKESSSWAIIKLYYSLFYSIRSFLMADGYCIFYNNRKPYILNTIANAIPQKRKGTSHEISFELFKQLNSGHYILSQVIDGKIPFDWYKEKREKFNYKISRFPEPELPEETETIIDYGIRKFCSECTLNATSILPFLSDYAILGFPLITLTYAVKQYKSKYNSHPYSDDDVSYITSISKDRNGPINPFLSIITPTP